MRVQWLLVSVCSIFLFVSPAEAGKLLSWQFKAEEKQLVFITDEGVQPKAQLLARPTRLVIDLPGTSLGRKTVKEKYSGRIRSLRVGQFDEQTTRIVVELAPGYTLDPQQVQFKGISPNQWTVNLPSPKIEPRSSSSLGSNSSRQEPQIIEIAPQSSLASTPNPKINPSRSSIIVDSRLPQPKPIQRNIAASNVPLTHSSYVKPTRNGFFISLDGNRNNQVFSRRSRDRTTIDFELEGVILPADLASKAVTVNQYGVSQIEFAQIAPNQARMSLKVNKESPDWNASFSRIRGLVLVPKVTIAHRNSHSFSSSATRVTKNKTTVEKISLSNNDTQLLITANHPVQAQTKQVKNGTYVVTIPNAQLAEPHSFQGPSLNARSPISEIRLKEEDSAVLITLQTRLGVRLGQKDRKANQLVALSIQKGLTPPPLRDRPLLSPSHQSRTIQVPQPSTNVLTRPIPRRSVPRSKPLVVIDAGHGGQDPGTIGIGGLREKDLVLPISLDVVAGLKKQGVEVRMTRDRDYFVTLKGRTDFANNVQADLFVSIHANAINLSRPDVNGLETYYYNDGRRLAEVIHWSILNSVNIKNRGIRRARFYVLRHSIMPAVLVEVGFVTGAEDAPRLKNPTHRSQMADAIVRGIIQYIKQKGL